MRMSYSAITDPCLSEEVIQQIDKTIAFFQKQSKKIPFNEKYDDEQYYINKIGKSLVSKFPQDQDDQLWRYIQSQLMKGLELPDTPNNTNTNGPHPETINHAVINGRKNSGEEEEIDDDEETALNEEQEEIDDDEETAIVERSQEEKISQHAAMPQVPMPPQSAPQNFSRNPPSMLTISQFSPMGTHMTFTRNQDGGQEVNLSIQETDQMQETAIAFPEMEVPLALTKNGSASDADVPLNFSSNRHQGEDEDSDEGRLVIKE